MKVYAIIQENGPIDTCSLRFLSRKDAINYILYVERAHAGTVSFRRDETGRYLMEELEMLLRVEHQNHRVVTLSADGSDLSEADLKPGGYFSIVEIRPLEETAAIPKNT